MPQHRELRYTDWDSVEQDLDLLLEGYKPQGNWNLAQTALHLNDWLRFPMDGFPQAPLPILMMLFLMRWTVGKSLLKKTLAQGFRDGTATMPATVHTASKAGDQTAVKQLRETIARFRQFSGPIVPSPLFGKLDYANAEKLQFVHFAHHLSLLLPATTPADETAE